MTTKQPDKVPEQAGPEQAGSDDGDGWQFYDPPVTDPLASGTDKPPSLLDSDFQESNFGRETLVSGEYGDGASVPSQDVAESVEDREGGLEADEALFQVFNTEPRPTVGRGRAKKVDEPKEKGPATTSPKRLF
jgi:hypothetical protein